MQSNVVSTFIATISGMAAWIFGGNLHRIFVAEGLIHAKQIWRHAPQFHVNSDIISVRFDGKSNIITFDEVKLWFW